MVSSARGPGRPRTKPSEAVKKSISNMIDEPLPDFVQTVEKYLKEAKWTKEQLMAAIGIGETQLYRWGRGDSMPRKATVNRICTVLAQRLDEVYGDEVHDPFPATDLIDAMLNEFLQQAGFSGSTRGKSGDDCWNRIAKDKLWKLGYTMVPGWAEKSTSRLKKPEGEAIKYAEKIGRLMGLETEWVYLPFEEMPLAIRERKLDGIAPIMLLLPGRLFDFRFSQRCSTAKFTLTALVPEKFGRNLENITELPTKQVEVIFVEGELGDWGQNLLGDEYNNRGFPDIEKACAYMQAFSDGSKSTKAIPVFLIDSITAKFLIDKYSSSELMTLKKIGIPVILETYSAFCFHPDEKRLANAVDLSIDLIPPFNPSHTGQAVESLITLESSRT
jgi:DNA-binding XRE family transcriptional regulator